MVQALGKTVYQFLTKLNKEFPYDPVMLLLAIHSKGTCIQTKTYTQMSAAALVTVSKDRTSQLSINQQIHKIYSKYIHTMECGL